MPRILYLHVGLYKTGTTSFQDYCLKNQAALREAGVALFQHLENANVYGLGVWIWRPELRAHSNLAEADAAAERAAWRQRLADFATAYPNHHLLVSTEALSHIRTDAEALALKSLLPTGYRVHALLVTRDKESWYASYTNQLLKMGLANASDPTSPNYLDPNGWITDWDTLRRLLREHFDELTEIEYQADTTRPLLEAMGVPIRADYRPLRANRRVTGWRLAVRSHAGRIKRSLGRIYRRTLINTPIGRAWRTLKLTVRRWALRSQYRRVP